MSEDPTRLLPNDDLKFIIAQLQLILSRMESLEQRQVAPEQRQIALEDKVDRHLQETRPIWEAVLAQPNDLKERQQRFEEEMLREVKRTRREFMATMRLESQVNADFRGDIEERLDDLESRNAA